MQDVHEQGARVPYAEAQRGDRAAPPGLLRSSVALAAVTLGGVALIGSAQRLLGQAVRPGAQLDEVVAFVVVTTGVLATVALTPGCAVLWFGALARVTGRRTRGCERAALRLAPTFLRRAVGVGVGLGLGVGALTPAAAEELDLGWRPTSHAPAPVAPAALTRTQPGAPVQQVVTADPDPDPDPVAAPAPAPAPAATVTATTVPVATAPASGDPATPVVDEMADDVVVAPGDSLWRIAEAHLADPTAAQVAAEWPRWYEANRDVIDDPDLILPGQRLRVPAPAPNQEQP